MMTWAELMALRSSSEERAAYLWHEASIPARFRDLRLETHPLMAGPTAPLLRRMIAGNDPSQAFWTQSWYLWGSVGVGKTGLAVGYAYQWVDPRYGEPSSVAYYSVPDLLARLRASYRPPGTSEARSAPATWTEGEWRTIRRCREADLLVLDDLGAEQNSRSGWAEDRLLLIVGWRHDQALPTMFTSNLGPTDMKGKVGERVVWRIVESCGPANVLHLKGPNLRAPWSPEDAPDAKPRNIQRH